MTHHITCESCTLSFQIKHEDDIEDSPAFCPFCGEKVFLEDEEIVFEDELDDEIESLDINDDMDT
jgi:hypothetical protein